MRIVVVTTSYPTDADCPAGHFVRTEVEQLLTEGHEVTLLLPRTYAHAAIAPGIAPTTHDASTPPWTTGALHAHELMHFGLFGWPGAQTRLRELPWRAFGLWPFITGARRALRRAGPFDRIVSHWILPGFWPICRDFDTETVVVAHGSDVGLLERLPSVLQRDVIRQLSRASVGLRCVSSELEQRMLRLFERHRRRACRTWIEPAAISVPQLPSRAQLRQRLALTSEPVVLVVGRLVAAKRVDLALTLLRNLIAARKLPDGTSCIVIGDGPLRAPLAQRFSNVRWLGHCSRPMTLQYLAAADLLVSASAAEGAPTVVREALALGTPVVAARAGDLRIWAEHQPTLTVVDAFSDDPSGAAGVAIRRHLVRAPLQNE
jgi:glycosyltransferase involved in cell wall biosynthesis